MLTFRSGIRDDFNNIVTSPMPGVFRELAGIEIEEFDVLRRPVQIVGQFSSTASQWCDVIKPIQASGLCFYDAEYYKGKPAVTVNDYGSGKVFYVGCDLDDTGMRELVEFVSNAATIPMIKAPPGVEMIKREGVQIVLNHNDYTVKLPLDGESLLTGGTI